MKAGDDLLLRAQRWLDSPIQGPEETLDAVVPLVRDLVQQLQAERRSEDEAVACEERLVQLEQHWQAQLQTERKEYELLSVHHIEQERRQEDLKAQLQTCQQERDGLKEKLSFAEVLIGHDEDVLPIVQERDTLRAQLDAIGEYGTAEINAAVELRQQLASTRVERDTLQAVIQAIRQLPRAVAGDSMYDGAVLAASLDLVLATVPKEIA